ncbi:MAG: hypothetical protein DI596_12580, partial [Azospira oryzae]
MRRRFLPCQFNEFCLVPMHGLGVRLRRLVRFDTFEFFIWDDLDLAASDPGDAFCKHLLGPVDHHHLTEPGDT